MKKLILILTMAAGLSATALAQPQAKSPEKRATHVTKVLQKTLNLSNDQAFQVHSIMLTQANRVDSLRSTLAAANSKPNKRAMRNIMASTDQNLSFVLSPEQQKAYYGWKAERKEKKQAKRNGTETMSANTTPEHES